MVKKLPVMRVYALLPKKNCGECSVPTCMAFAAKLAAREVELEACPYLASPFKDSLLELLSPPVRLVTVGRGERLVRVGGEEVLYRHELRFNSPSALAVMVHDGMDEAELRRVVEYSDRTTLMRMGQTLRLDLVAVRSTTQNPSLFARAVGVVSRLTSMPLVLCSFKPSVMEAGLKVCGGSKPLIFAACEENLLGMVELAARFECPLAVHGDNLEQLSGLVNKVVNFGLTDLVIDITATSLPETLDNMVQARVAAVRRDVKELGYPTVAFPGLFVGDAVNKSRKLEEVIVASTQLLRYASIIVLSSPDAWATLPLMALRQNIFTDPQKPVLVKPGLYEVGEPDGKSPVLLTANYALTFYTVFEDLKAGGIPCYLLVADTEGLSVATSLAGSKLTASRVAETLSSSGVEKKVEHRTLLIPGTASRLRGYIEDETGWKVVVGPKDSAGLPEFLRGFRV